MIYKLFRFVLMWWSSLTKACDILNNGINIIIDRRQKLNVEALLMCMDHQSSNTKRSGSDRSLLLWDIWLEKSLLCIIANISHNCSKAVTPDWTDSPSRPDPVLHTVFYMSVKLQWVLNVLAHRFRMSVLLAAVKFFWWRILLQTNIYADRIIF